MNYYHCEKYTLFIPDGWGLEEGKSSIALFRQNGGSGSLNISTATFPGNGGDSLLNLFELLSGSNLVPKLHSSNQEGVELASGDVERDARWWKFWVFRRPKDVVFCSYNCRSEQTNASEIEEAERIVGSIALL